VLLAALVSTTKPSHRVCTRWDARLDGFLLSQKRRNTMMSRQTAVIRTEYREHDNPFPVFNCPVLFAGRVLRYGSDGRRFREVADTLLREAAHVADLVERLSEPVEYIDFAVHDGFQNIDLRMRFIERNGAVMVRIDFLRKPVSYRQADVASPTPMISSMAR
jgi:hypothetical protein